MSGKPFGECLVSQTQAKPSTCNQLNHLIRLIFTLSQPSVTDYGCAHFELIKLNLYIQ